MVKVTTESLQAVEAEAGAAPAVLHVYSLTALNTDPVELTSALNMAVDRGDFTAALRAAGFSSASAVSPVSVVDVSEMGDPLKCTTLRVAQVGCVVLGWNIRYHIVSNYAFYISIYVCTHDTIYYEYLSSFRP